MSDPFNPESFPLHDSARDKKNLLVKDLSKKEPALVLTKDGDGRTPLLWAASSGNSEGLSILLKAIKETPSLSRKFDIDDSDNGGWTLLHIASSTGNNDILDLLQPWDPEVNIQTAAGQTALHYATSKGHIDTVRKLLAEPFKASPRIRDKLGQLPLHRAAAVGSLPIVNLLIEAKAPLNATDNTGWTAFHHAMVEGHGDVAVELVKAGANPDHVSKAAVQGDYDPKTKEFVRRELQK